MLLNQGKEEILDVGSMKENDCTFTATVQTTAMKQYLHRAIYISEILYEKLFEELCN